jgi:alkanesulfonate monooxygenase SsuD/methylene tetrahydromethanopterin reductase-like flavin-dependent oxidoreductase (luciferase family)
LESVESIHDQSWSRLTRERVQRGLESAVAGSPATVRARLDDLRRRTGADELLASTSTFDRGALARSDALLRDLLA